MDKKTKKVMMVSTVLFLIPFAIIFLIALRQSPNPKPVDHNWLVLLHPPGFCKIPAESCSNVARAETQQFTIHGLWPVDSRGRTIRGDPSKAPPVNLNDILADPILTNDLTQLWPNMSGGIEPYDDFGLWRDEWAKHGWLDPSYNYNALEYFRRTIAADKLEGAVVMESLRKKGLIPGNSYTLAQYRDAIESETKVLNSAVLQCYEDDGIFHLSEVRFCVDKQGTSFIGCNQRELDEEGKKCGAGYVTLNDS
ncbi:hypothetical protein QYF36_002951 [Acer negundo]|nr:hypothetical protein QYF36_002951 [Acer negundo]